MWDDAYAYLRRREAVGANVEVVEMDMAELERQVQVGFLPTNEPHGKGETHGNRIEITATKRCHSSD